MLETDPRSKFDFTNCYLNALALFFCLERLWNKAAKGICYASQYFNATFVETFDLGSQVP